MPFSCPVIRPPQRGTWNAGRGTWNNPSMRGLQSDLTKIYEAALGAADPYASVLARVRRRGNSVDAGGQSYSLGSYRAVHVVGAGKASAEMARAVEELVGDRLQKGLLVVRDLPPRDVPSMRILQASHPEPDERGLMASRTLIHYLESEVSEDDLLIVLLSGGASALLPSPVQGISLDDKKVTTQVLLSCGATIHEINTIRKHLSRLKGGRLLNHARGATVLALIVSDVVGDDPSTIASGPTSPDPSTFRECLDVLDRYRINTRIPETVLSYLQESARSPHGLETLKEGDPLLQRTSKLPRLHQSSQPRSRCTRGSLARLSAPDSLRLNAGKRGRPGALLRIHGQRSPCDRPPPPRPLLSAFRGRNDCQSRGAVEKGGAIRSSPSGVSMRRGPGRVHQRSSPPLGRTDPMVRRRRPEPSCRQPRGLGPRSWGWIPGTTCNETTPTTSSSSSTT